MTESAATPTAESSSPSTTPDRGSRALAMLGRLFSPVTGAVGVFGECVQVPHALEQPTDLVAFDSDADGWVEFFAIGYEGQLSRVQLGPARDK